MAESRKPLSELLDEMALKILMIEPGDLSVVGDLLDLVEKLLPGESAEGIPDVIQQMGLAFKGALERIIMGELDDSGENYDLLGQCVSQMQETVRKEGKADEKIIARFCENLGRTGYSLDPNAFLGVLGPGAVRESEPHLEPGGGQEAPQAAAASAPPEPRPAEAVPDFLQDKDLLAGFIEEAFEHLESIEVNVLELEQSPDDLDIINNIFRPFHTIKGVSGFLNLKTINRLAHATENLLDDVRNGKRAMDSAVIDIVLTVGDVLKSMVANIKEVLEGGLERYRETDISGFLAEITRLQQGEEEGAAPEASVAPSLPAGAVGEAEEAGDEEAEEEEAAASAPSSGPTAPAGAAAAGRRPPPGGGGAARPGAGGEATQKKISSSIKVDVEKLDALVNAVGELVIMQSLVRQNKLVSRIADPKLTKDFSQLSRITSELQRTAMSMRMVPIKQTFDKMIRLVRDLSKKTGKKVDLVMEGAETEIDRNMVDSIYDPLVHMMRNSVDHGIQLPADRVKCGKPETGRVSLRAYQKGGSMVIEIEDDGEGLHTRKIQQKARERGLIGEADNLSDFELNNLIFLPGFSTADKITDVSGRGVGMDVVKRNIEGLRGTVDVRSELGKGSTFTVKLPLTLAIIDGMMVKVGSEVLTVPLSVIDKSVRPKPEEVKTVEGKGELIDIRGDYIPLVRLYELFEIPTEKLDPTQALVLIVQSSKSRYGILVDDVLGQTQAVIKSIDKNFRKIDGTSGATILGDGRVSLILDIYGIERMAFEGATEL